MNEIKFIDIELYSINRHVLIHIDYKNREYSIDGITRKILLSKLEKLLSIIRTWDNHYKSYSDLDKEEFKVSIKTDNTVEIFEGKGDYPKNYSQFKEWIGELNVN